MTDPVSVLRRDVDVLIQAQIRTKPESQLAIFRTRSENIGALFKMIEMGTALPGTADLRAQNSRPLF